MATALRRDPIVQLGEFLRSARERSGLTLQQVSSTTKIPQRHLDAIEHGDISVVPRGPYRRGEVRAFAEAVGLDQKVALAQFDEALPIAPEPSAPFPVEPVEPGISWTGTVTLLVAVAGLVALVLWNRDAASTTNVAPSSMPAVGAAATPAPQATEATPHPVPTPQPAPTVTPPVAQTPASPAVRPVLLVTSDPPGARVVVDGIGRGTTPAAIELLALGEHSVRVVRDGYVSEERRVALTPKRPTATVDVALRRQQ